MVRNAKQGGRGGRNVKHARRPGRQKPAQRRVDFVRLVGLHTNMADQSDSGEVLVARSFVFEQTLHEPPDDLITEAVISELLLLFKNDGPEKTKAIDIRRIIPPVNAQLRGGGDFANQPAKVAVAG